MNLSYADRFPDTLPKLFVIEGLGLSPERLKTQAEQSPPTFGKTGSDRDGTACRTPRRYPTIEAAIGWIRESNEHLTVEQALKLTSHGVNHNEDGSYG